MQVDLTPQEIAMIRRLIQVGQFSGTDLLRAVLALDEKLEAVGSGEYEQVVLASKNGKEPA